MHKQNKIKEKERLFSPIHLHFWRHVYIAQIHVTIPGTQCPILLLSFNNYDIGQSTLVSQLNSADNRKHDLFRLSFNLIRKLSHQSEPMSMFSISA